jgi:uncharacterized membrane protein
MTKWRPFVTTVICVAGVGLAGFLTWGHYFDQPAISNSCSYIVGHPSESGLVNCGAVTTSSESVILGLPVALYGLLYFIVMLGLCLPKAWRSTSARLARLRLGLNVAGMGFVLYLIGVEALALHHICIYCTGVHVLQFALFLVVVTGWEDTGYVHAQWQDEEQAEMTGAAATG